MVGFHVARANRMPNIKPFPSYRGLNIERKTAIAQLRKGPSKSTRNCPEIVRMLPADILRILLLLVGNRFSCSQAVCSDRVVGMGGRRVWEDRRLQGAVKERGATVSVR